MTELAKIMVTSSFISSLQVGFLGEAAKSFLLSNSDGRVLAGFSKAIYLVNAQDDICWLAAKKAPMHRRSVQVGGPLPRVKTNSSYTVKNQKLILSQEIVFDLTEARSWKSVNPRPTRFLSLPDLNEHYLAFISLMDQLPPPEGFGILIPNILNLIQEQPPSRPNAALDDAPKFAWPTIQELAKACLARDFLRVIELADELVGLGEGLTPSGDDFIGGLLFCLESLRHTYTSLQNLGFPNLEPFLSRTKSRTNLISFTLLKDHADGHASELLHKFMHAQLTGQSFEFMQQSATELIQIGHSSGWDLLTGILAGLLVVVGMSKKDTYQVQSSAYYKHS